LNEIGKWLVVAGVALVAVGLWMWIGPKVPWLGRLPGDIVIERPNLRFYFPLTTSILLSLVLTLLIWMLRRH
jgi:hypothetical protein